MGKLVSKVTSKVIEAIMDKSIKKLDFVEDFSGELHEGKIARVLIEGSTNADHGETISYVRKGKNKDLVVMFSGGGVSWNEETAKFPMNPETAANTKTPALYSPTVTKMSEFSTFCLSKTPGLMSPTEENKFADWNLIMINYVTGDFHVGRNDFAYTDDNGARKILHHQGHSNFRKAMDRCKEFFPEIDRLLIVGGSAGAFAVPALAAEVTAYYPDCKDVTVYSDSCLLLMDDYKSIAKNVWKADDALVEAIHTSDISADWYEYLYSLKGDSIRYLYSNSCEDYLLATFQNYIDNSKYAVTSENCEKFKRDLKAHIERLRKACPKMGFYVNDTKPFQPKTPGTEHCMILNDALFQTNAPISGMQWLCDAVNGKVYDFGLELLS